MFNILEQLPKSVAISKRNDKTWQLIDQKNLYIQNNKQAGRDFNN